MRLLILVLVVARVVVVVNAAVVDPQFKKASVFFFASTNANPVGSQPIGTGFYVSVPKTNGEALYLVTARHVIHDTSGNPRSNVLLWVRSNVRDGSNTVQVRMPLTGASAVPTYLHPDSAVDLAVLLFAVPTSDSLSIPLPMVLSSNAVTDRTIQEGDEVFFTGLFTPHYGAAQNIPIFRFGRVAMLSREPVQWFDKKTDLYLIDTFCFGGNSGSPVFLSYTLDRTGGTRLLVGPNTDQKFLAGVLIGNFGDFDKVRWVETAVDGYARNNTGISAVVPAYRLRELLNHPDLKRMRGE